jgi:Ca2+-binding EF-hand superfamily protein
MPKFTQTLSVAATALLIAGSTAYAADAAAALKALDPDNDGTIDMQEAEAGAKKVWESINDDDDDTLEADELQGMLDEKGLDMADPDDDDTLDWAEYKALVEKKFKAANPDDDGTVDLKELESPAGQELMTLIYKS